MPKETAHATEQSREDVLIACRLWFEGQLDLNPDRLVFINEIGATTKAARLRGWALRGNRCRASEPHGHWKTTTFSLGLRRSGLMAPLVLNGPMDGAAFPANVELILVKELNPEGIVVIDDLPAHKVSGVSKAMEGAEAHLLDLLPHSPDVKLI